MLRKPPFLVFDISAEFANDVKDLSRIPYEISVYGDKYSFAGVTSFVRRREHFVGYISLENNRILFYDGLPATNSALQIYPRAAIQGDTSLLLYFPCDDFEGRTPNSSILDKPNTGVIKTTNSSSQTKQSRNKQSYHSGSFEGKQEETSWTEKEPYKEKVFRKLDKTRQ